MLPAENSDNKIKEFWPKDGPSAQEAGKYVKKYINEKIVIKCGGKVLLDPALFKNFIDENIKLEPVIFKGNSSIEDVLSYYMGKNTPQRQNFIIDNLRLEE